MRPSSQFAVVLLNANLQSRARQQAVTNIFSQTPQQAATLRLGVKAFTKLSRHSDSPESGYAMLLVFAMSAMIAVGLYMQLPRAAFEAQREKEQLLIDHGEQYKRAIQLYYRKFSRYPAKMEDLENTGNIRFLRRRFIDPMTGKDEWRLVHMGPGGQLTDSLIKKTDPNKEEWNNKFITEFKSAAASDNGGEQAVNMATRHRASDDKIPGSMPGAGGAGAPTDANGNPLTASNAGMTGVPALPGAPGVPTSGVPGQPGTPPQRFIVGPNGQLMPAGVANNSGTFTQNTASNSNSGSGGSISGNGGYGSSSIGGNGGFGNSTNNAMNNPYPNGVTAPAPAPGASPFGAPVNSQYQGQSPYSTMPGTNQTGNFQQPGQQITPGQQISPTQMMNNLLTQPRPGGPPPGIGTPVTGGTGGTTVGGLAGVATTYKGKGIHTYNDQDEYQKWEFYYDLTQDAAAARQQAGLANATGAQQANPNVQQTINNQMNPGGMTNSGSSFGNTGFGNAPIPTAPQPPQQVIH